jgi:anti-sigma factor RsiW
MTADDDLKFLSDETIDALVDGTLDDDHRRTLLLDLEADPEGWRRCAMAFLEAQAWTQALAPLADHQTTPRSLVLVTEDVQVVPLSSGETPISGERRWDVRRPIRLAMRSCLAAGLLALAFGAGLFANRLSSQDRPTIAASTPSPATPPPVVSQVPTPEFMDVAANDPIDEFAAAMDTTPGHVRRQLASQGYKVEQRRMLVDVPLEDGRLVAVPVDQVSFEYVGNQAL